jgi:hypothetical protein
MYTGISGISGVSGFSQSFTQDPSRDFRLDDEVTKIDNGGLFAKERCKRLAK